MQNISIIERKHAMRLSKLTGNIVQLIMQHDEINEYNAIKNFYNSQTYELLSNYNTKLWWYSIYAIFEIYKIERETGSVFNSSYFLENYS